MAQDRLTNVVILGDGEATAEIIYGPSEEYLCLCLRGIVPEVTFATKQSFSFPAFHGTREFICGPIYSLTGSRMSTDGLTWKIKGANVKERFRFPYEALYDPRTRKGTAIF